MIRCSLRSGALTLFALLATFAAAQAGPYSVLYSFQGWANNDGSQPQGNLVLDSSGNLWGATFEGGQQNCGTAGVGCGTVFELAPGGTETEWTICCEPNGGLFLDSNGNLWGTTQGSENATAQCPRQFKGGCGQVFELPPQSQFGWNLIYPFDNSSSNPNDGYAPAAAMLHLATRAFQKGQKTSPTFYGTTTLGGGGTLSNCGGNQHNYDVGCGAVYKVNENGVESVLYGFQGSPDGQTPSGPVIADPAGNLYGVTQNGGANFGGTIYKITPTGQETVLYSFTGGSDGAGPQSNLVLDSSGNLYGTTLLGGGSGCQGAGCGTVFQLAPNGALTVLYAFTGGLDGSEPWSSLVRDQKGNLYGVTEYGGNTNCNGLGCGVVYEINPRGVEIVLHAFAGAGASDGQTPSGLILGPGGLLYGTTQYGGTGCDAPGCGTVFSVYQFR